MKLHVLLFSAVAVGGLVAGCSSQDPGAVTFGTRHVAGGGGSEGNQNSAGADSGASGDAGGGGGGGGGEAGVAHDAGAHDAAVEAEAGPPNAFTGAVAYASRPVTPSAEQEHINRNVGTVPTGQGCLGCHNGATATRFGVGGTVYKDVAGTIGAPDIEIRVVKGDGTEYASVHSDANGNFWLVDANGFGALNGKTGARNATTTVLMTGLLSQDGCNGCHNGTNTARIHIP